MIEEAEVNLRALLKIGDDHRVLFCQGGASMQFAMVPMNLLRDGAAADLVVTGSWGAKAATEAARVGRARVAWTGDTESFVRVPTDEELLGALDPAAAYVHLTTNETIQGVEFPATPVLPDEVVLAADHSSDFLSRPVDVARYAVLYAGAQKNAGPAGVTIVDDPRRRARTDPRRAPDDARLPHLRRARRRCPTRRRCSRSTSCCS